MAVVRTPAKRYQLGEPLPPIDVPTTPWKWGNTPSLQEWSSSLLGYPLGTVVLDVVDGYPAVAQVQTHYAYGAHPEWPNKPHKGTSVFSLAEGRRALATPPEGWPASFAGESETAHHKAAWTMLAVAGVVLGAVWFGPLEMIVGVVTGLSANWLLWRRRS